MKKVLFGAFVMTLLLSCNDKKNKVTASENVYESFGDSISDQSALSSADMKSKFENMKVGDTINVKFQSKIKKVCKKKGCWMILDLTENKEAFVKFKDYAFFVPKNADNEDVILSGKAYVGQESIEDLKHYAKDAGKSQASIDSIVAPKTTYSIMADGVLIKK